MARKFNKYLTEGIVSYIAVEGLAKRVIVTFLMTDNVEPINGMVTRMMTKHRTQLLSTTKEDLRPRLANLKSKFAKLKCFFQLVMTLFL